MSRWQRYWFADGGRYAVAIVRIAIAVSVLLSLGRLAGLPSLVTPGVYRPVGIWMLLGHTVPPTFLIQVLWVLAWVATVAMLLGYRTRAATAVSFGAAVSLAALSFSSSVTWSHQYNVVFLAQLAFVGARGGDALSIDAAIRAYRGQPAIAVPRGYQWSLRLVQLAVALMFAGAVFHKILHGHFTLRWALSDNLRHHLLVRYDLADLPRPALVDWMIDDVWRYRTAAVLNMVSQLTPIFACIFIRRPWIRALCGAFFVIETLALGLVVSLWNLHWIPLVAAFIDWDAVIARVGRRSQPPEALPAGWAPPRRVRIFIVAFVVYDAVTAFAPAVDQWLNTYPFSGFPMFATIRANAPYDEHLPYAVTGDHFEATARHPVHDRAQRWLDHTNRNLYLVHDPKQMHARLSAILAEAQRRYPELEITGLRHYLTIFEAPAYPARAHFESHPIAVTAELAPDGSFHTVLGSLTATTVELRPELVDASATRLIYFAGEHPAAIDLPATRDGNRFTISPLDGDPIYVAAVIGGTPWLVATRKAWRWQ